MINSYTRSILNIELINSLASIYLPDVSYYDIEEQLEMENTKAKLAEIILIHNEWVRLLESDFSSNLIMEILQLMEVEIDPLEINLYSIEIYNQLKTTDIFSVCDFLMYTKINGPSTKHMEAATQLIASHALYKENIGILCISHEKRIVLSRLLELYIKQTISKGELTDYLLTQCIVNGRNIDDFQFKDVRIKEFNRLLIKKFPNLLDSYNDEIELSENEYSGSHIIYGNIFKNYLNKCLDEKDINEINKCLKFIESILCVGNEYTKNVMDVSVIEMLIYKLINYENINEYPLICKSLTYFLELDVRNGAVDTNVLDKFRSITQ